MGSRLGWLAARSRSQDELLALLNLKASGDALDQPEAPVCGSHLSTGWYVIVVNEPDALPLQQAARDLSQQHDVVALSVEEPVGFASATGFAEGAVAWRVVHNRAEQGVLHLETEGALPIELAGIRAWHEHDQRAKGGADSEVDCMIEIPLDLAKRIVGFRHDAPGSHWDVLEHVSPRESVRAPATSAPPNLAPAPPPPPRPVPVLVDEAPPPKEKRKRRRRKQAPKAKRSDLQGARRKARRGLFGLLMDFLERLGDEGAANHDEAKRQGLIARSRARRKKRRRERERQRP